MTQHRLILVALLISGCTTSGVQQELKPKPTGEYQWQNDSLYATADRGEIPEAQVNHEFITAKNTCKIAALKVPVPSPSCTQPPKRDCTGKTGFALGFCQIYTPQPRCNYSSVNAAYDAQGQIYNSCMDLKGWSKVWVPYSSESTSTSTTKLTATPLNTENDDVVQAAIDAIPELADWQKDDEKKWNLAVAIDSEIRERPEYEDMLLTERFRVIVEKVKAVTE